MLLPVGTLRPHEWVPVDSRLCAVKLRCSRKINSWRTNRCNFLCSSRPMPTEGNLRANRQLHQPLLTADRADIVVLMRDVSAAAERLYLNKKHLGDPFGFDFHRPEIRIGWWHCALAIYCFFALRISDVSISGMQPGIHPIQISTGPRPNTWQLPISGCIYKTSRLTGGLPAIPICTMTSIKFGRQKSARCDKFAVSSVTDSPIDFPRRLNGRLEPFPSNSINEHSSDIKDIRYSDGTVNCAWPFLLWH